MIKWHQFYLPIFSLHLYAIFGGYYIPPQARPDTAFSEMYEVLTHYQANHQDEALIVAVDFRSSEQKKIRPDLNKNIAVHAPIEATRL